MQIHKMANSPDIVQKVRPHAAPDRSFFKRLKLTLAEDFSLSEEDSGLLSRTALIGSYKSKTFLGLMHQETALRLNIHNNLDNLNQYRTQPILPVRGDIDAFSDKRLHLERSHVTFAHSFKSDLHMLLSAGYLEEMYAGLGGEILYRPISSRFALGAEAWQAFKRDPASNLGLALNGDHILSTHLKGWYDLPYWDVTVRAKAGRYLAGDLGAEIGILKRFENGAELSAFTMASTHHEPDIYGGKTHHYHGLSLTLPLGSLHDLLGGSQVRVKAAPLGRNIGQSIEAPEELYSLTEPFTIDEMARHWNNIAE